MIPNRTIASIQIKKKKKRSEESSIRLKQCALKDNHVKRF